MRSFICNVISVILTHVRCIIWKLLPYSNIKTKGLLRFSPDVVCEFERGSSVSLGHRVRVHSGCKLKVRDKATLNIGDEVILNYGCIVVCRENISIGYGTGIAPYVLIYDHDHDIRPGHDLKTEFRTSPVVIGKNCWIGAHTMILRGSVIGDNCIIGAGSVVKGVIPPETIYIQKRVVEYHSRKNNI